MLLSRNFDSLSMPKAWKSQRSPSLRLSKRYFFTPPSSQTSLTTSKCQISIRSIWKNSSSENNPRFSFMDVPEEGLARLTIEQSLGGERNSYAFWMCLAKQVMLASINGVSSELRVSTKSSRPTQTCIQFCIASTSKVDSCIRNTVLPPVFLSPTLLKFRKL